MSDASIVVLLVEDNPADAYLTRRVLSELDMLSTRVEVVDRIANARTRLAEGGVDLVVLDLSLPDGQGVETFRRIRESAPTLPVIVLSGLEDEAVALEAVRWGAQDYLVKGRFNGQLLGRSVRYALERQKLQSQLFAAALEDEMTGLYNRRGFQTLAADDLKRARRHRNPIVLAFGDLDGLKSINDTFGHLEGDRAICDAASILRATFREADLVARIGGDEFAVLLRDASDCPDRARSRLQGHLDEHNRLSGRSYGLSISLGFVRHAMTDDLTLEALLSAADKAMYDVKHSRRSAARTPA
ncbi:MAG: GGDEF domain-containing response regulator [Gemmatimonadales bacterium]|nr:GGDEF domain-containing response regulator [Gemmatimonadales bacterium]